LSLAEQHILAEQCLAEQHILAEQCLAEQHILAEQCLAEQHVWRSSMFGGASRLAEHYGWRSRTFLKKQLVISKKALLSIAKKIKRKEKELAVTQSFGGAGRRRGSTFVGAAYLAE